MADNIVLRVKDTINRGHSVMWNDAAHLGELYEKEMERNEEMRAKLRLISVTLSLGSKEAVAEALRIARG